MKKYFVTIDKAIDEIKKGKMLILVDSPDRENEGDLYMPVDTLSHKEVMAMVRKGGGLLCVALTKTQAQKTGLSLMVPLEQNSEKTRVNFTVSVNAKKGITTGVSAFDRLKTIKLLGGKNTKPQDLVSPGHVFGLVASDGGLSERKGHTEAAVDLARLSGFSPAGVLCEIISKSGRMAKIPELFTLAGSLGIKMVTLDDLSQFLKKNPLPKFKSYGVSQSASSTLHTQYGRFKLIIYTSLLDNRTQVVLTRGNYKKEPALVRLHSQCFTGETLHSLRCDCKEQLHQSMKLIQKKGHGIIIYLAQEGRGIGLTNKIRAYALQDKGLDTVGANHFLGFPADPRDYKIAAEILSDLKVKKIILLTNNPQKEKKLLESGVSVVKTLPLETVPNKINRKYLMTKKRKLNHRLKQV